MFTWARETRKKSAGIQRFAVLRCMREDMMDCLGVDGKQGGGLHNERM